MAEIDIGPLKANRLQPGHGVAAVTALAGNRIFPDDAAKIGAAAVLCNRVPFEVDADNRGAGQLCKLILHFLPKRDIQDALHVKIHSGHG